jgi:hypothetical protein
MRFFRTLVKSSAVSTKVTNFFCKNSRLNITKYCTIAVLANNRFKTLDDYHANDGKTEVRCLLHTEMVETVKKLLFSRPELGCH